MDPAEQLMARWVASGASELSGRPGAAPISPPEGFLRRLYDIAAMIARTSTAIGAPVHVDPSVELAARARIARLGRRGSVSCGGATRLLRAADGWLGVTLARAEDWELLPAWFELDHEVADGDWDAVGTAVAARTCDELGERSQLLGLPVAVLGERVAPVSTGPTHPVGGAQVGGAPACSALDDVVVVDLSSLWAGPLASAVLRAAGARIVKVESSGRPDGARRGPREFFDHLNAHKQVVSFDLRGGDGRAALRRLIDDADVVITSSRQRAIDQLDLPLAELVASGRPRVWLSITGYGRVGAGADRVAFGDDAAIAGGLVVWDDEGPCCFADAVADPCTGLAGAAAVLRALELGGSWILDAAMSDVAAHLAG